MINRGQDKVLTCLDSPGIEVDNDVDEQFTVIKISCQDQKGILMKVSGVLYSMDLNVEKCVGQHVKEEMQQQFILTVACSDQEGNKVTSEDLLADLLDQLHQCVFVTPQPLKQARNSASPTWTFIPPVPANTSGQIPRVWRLTSQVARLQKIVKQQSSELQVQSARTSSEKLIGKEGPSELKNMPKDDLAELHPRSKSAAVPSPFSGHAAISPFQQSPGPSFLSESTDQGQEPPLFTLSKIESTDVKEQQSKVANLSYIKNNSNSLLEKSNSNGVGTPDQESKVRSLGSMKSNDSSYDKATSNGVGTPNKQNSGQLVQKLPLLQRVSFQADGSIEAQIPSDTHSLSSSETNTYEYLGDRGDKFQNSPQTSSRQENKRRSVVLPNFMQAAINAQIANQKEEGDASTRTLDRVVSEGGSVLGELGQGRGQDVSIRMSRDTFVEDIMSSPVLTIDWNADWHMAIHRMKQYEISSLLVETDDVKNPGFVTKRDLIRFWSNLQGDCCVRVRDVMKKPVIAVEIGTTLDVVGEELERRKIRRVCVLDPQTCEIVGIVTDSDIFRQAIGIQSFKMYPRTTPQILNARNSSIDIRSQTASYWEVDIKQVQFLHKIGQGSYGEVWVAKWCGSEIAVKRLFQPGEANKRGQEMITASGIQDFEREVGYLATLRHPNIVQFLGVSHMDGSVALLLEFCPLGSLDRVLHKSVVNLSLGMRLKMAICVARGMSFLHSLEPPVVHNDLKSANLLVGSNFVVKIGDFGLSRTLRVGTNVPVGTAEYSAPEILSGDNNSLNSVKSDIWSFGIVLWELLMRERPYGEVAFQLRIVMGVSKREMRVPQVPPELASPILSDLVESCLEWEAEKRPDFDKILQVLESEYRLLRNRGAVSRDLSFSRGDTWDDQKHF